MHDISAFTKTHTMELKEGSERNASYFTVSTNILKSTSHSRASLAKSGDLVGLAEGGLLAPAALNSKRLRHGGGQYVRQ